MTALMLVLAALAFGVEPASACSCAIGDPRAALAEADAAFVGRLVEIRGPDQIQSSADPAVYVFAIDQVVKGELASTVEVVSAISGASCGIEAPLGKRIGLFLMRDGDAWRSSLCQQIDADRLLAAVRPLPAPDGTGPLAMLVGGRFGEYRTLALDATGRTLAYGEGAGTAYWFSTCPGGRRVIEVAGVGERYLVAVRDLRTFRLIAEREVPTPGFTSPAAVRCVARDGSDAFIAVVTSEFPERTRIFRLRSGGTTTVWRGTALAVALSRGVAYVNGGRRGRSLHVVDLGGGTSRFLATIPPYAGPLVASPDGSALVGVAYSAPTGRNAPPSRIVLVRSGAGAVTTAPLQTSNVTGDVVWLDRHRFTFFPRGRVDRVRTYDASLRLRAAFAGWDARGAAVVGTRAFGIGWTGSLFTAPLPRGPVRTVRELPSPVVSSLARVTTPVRVVWTPPSARRAGDSEGDDTKGASGLAVATLATLLAGGIVMRLRASRRR